MWVTSVNTIQMCEGDFGIALPMTITGPTFATSDEIKMAIKDAMNGNTLLEKTFSDIQDNTISIELTSSETEQLPVGNYVYSIDWYQEGHFLCNIVPASNFKVVDKA